LLAAACKGAAGACRRDRRHPGPHLQLRHRHQIRVLQVPDAEEASGVFHHTSAHQRTPAAAGGLLQTQHSTDRVCGSVIGQAGTAAQGAIFGGAAAQGKAAQRECFWGCLLVGH
jgi:hypothetical protein